MGSNIFSVRLHALDGHHYICFLLREGNPSGAPFQTLRAAELFDERFGPLAPDWLLEVHDAG